MTEDEKKPRAEGGAPNAEEFLPPLEFSSVVILLFFPALIQLGLVEDPATNQISENLGLAKRNIDLLDLLKDRTKGNLEPEERQFLEGAIDQLKMAYLKKAEIVKM
ncbi:MAG TPA: DUF1844 domain-containing protein [Acidobacteriota bacterium]|nr:DUF1844 domain-containing protein [Acidobacteriota bacterium]